MWTSWRPGEVSMNHGAEHQLGVHVPLCNCMLGLRLGVAPLYTAVYRTLHQVPKVSTTEGLHCIQNTSQGVHNRGAPLYSTVYGSDVFLYNTCIKCSALKRVVK